MNSLALMQALIFEPKKAFTELDVRPRSLLPLLLVILSTAGIFAWYYQVVDLSWMTDGQLRNSFAAKYLTDAQITERAKSAGEHVTRATVIAVLSAVFLVVIFRLVEAVYYLLVGKMTGVRRSFAHWFSLSCWTSLPAVLAVIPAAVVLGTATTAQIDQPSVLQPLSLNALIFHRTPDEAGFSVLTSLSVLYFLGVYLAAAGVRAWSGRSWLFGILFTFTPMLVFYGGWAALSLGNS